MGAAIFWGSILILIGLALVIKVVFNVDFPVFKILIAFLFIYLGLRILFGSFGLFSLKSGPNDVIFSERFFSSPYEHPEYNVVFAHGVFDFRDIDLSEGTKNIKIGTVFGGSQIKIKRDMPVRINADAVFAGAELPDGNTAVFGSSTYTSESFNPDSAHLNIKIDVVFGGVQILRE